MPELLPLGQAAGTSFAYSFLLGLGLSGGNVQVGIMGGSLAVKACLIHAVCTPLFDTLFPSFPQTDWLKSALTSCLVLTGTAFLSHSLLGLAHLLENLALNLLVHSCLPLASPDVSSKLFVIFV